MYGRDLSYKIVSGVRYHTRFQRNAITAASVAILSDKSAAPRPRPARVKQAPVSLYNLAGVSRRRKSSNGGKVTEIGIPLDGIRIFPQILHIPVDRRPLLPLLMELELRLVPPLASRPSQHSDRRRTRLVSHHRLRIRRLSLNDRLLLRLLRLQLVIRSRSIPFRNRLSLPQRH
ncbi:unnamed protein product [Citrullus colocynthis]|uniref:Uncharacterized protein n=1 Tax=Citrullus colocynthis TaxID=252529 RepID=A0ABP0Y644_9ROSI